MGKTKSLGIVTVNISLELTETEARALDAMTKYGHKSFLEGVYTKLGKSYMQPYEAGVISLFETIKKELPQHFFKIDKAREALEQQKIN